MSKDEIIDTLFTYVVHETGCTPEHIDRARALEILKGRGYPLESRIVGLFRAYRLDDYTILSVHAQHIR